MQHYEAEFIEAYKILNEEQKRAVETLDGPVLVLAGPGSGKTQVLAIRIGNLLRQVDSSPKNILCLTFTEAGTIAMKKRLLKFLGPTAYQIDVMTFHGFCNKVIQEHIELFGGYLDLQPLSELEEVDVYRELIDSWSNDHPLKRLTGDMYYGANRLKSLFRLMKQEDWTAKYIKEKIDEYLASLPDREEFQYKRAYTNKKGERFEAGDVKPHLIKKERDKLEKTAAAADELVNYQRVLHEKKRYDYQDMLQWVLRAFEKHTDLLSEYQERYQHILVDEYQDTNGVQNKVVDLLCSYWERPNVFVVGDDDQAIYRFQGANMGNITEFNVRYEPELVVLSKNYRSSQIILDTAGTLIAQNQERLVNKLEGLDKTLEAKGKFANLTQKVQLREYSSVQHEEGDIVESILELQEKGVPLNKIGVIYRQHRQAENIVEILSKKNIPVKMVKKVNILHLPLIRNLLNLLSYLQGERIEAHSEQARLFEIMHYGFVGIGARDTGRIAAHIRSFDWSERPKWRDVIEDVELLRKIGVQRVAEVKKLADNINYWLDELENITLQMLFEKILTHGGVLNWLLTQSQQTFQMQVLTTLFDHIKEETAKNPQLHLEGFLDMIEKLDDNAIPIQFNQVLHAEDGINFMSAHGAKGLEFEHVFLMGCTENFWEKQWQGNRSYALPPTIDMSNETDIEDERRLFFVAMTRAKHDLRISWARTDQKGKERIPSQFIEEIRHEDGVECVEPELIDEQILTYYQQLLLPGEPTTQLIDHDLIDRILENFTMNVTGLNKYLECPLSFYFENILRVPSARNKYMGFGNAVHYALERYFRDIKVSRPSGGLDIEPLQAYYREGMERFASHFTEKEYDNYLVYGLDKLPAYATFAAGVWLKPRDYALEYTIREAHHEGVPISGKLDKVEIFRDRVIVVDYKTGKPDRARKKLKRPDEKEPLGGDYWRQLTFYKILLQADKRSNWVLQEAALEFIQPNNKDEFEERHSREITVEDVQIVTEQLVNAYERIQAHDFEQGCGEDDCYWCNFAMHNIGVEKIPSGEEVE